MGIPGDGHRPFASGDVVLPRDVGAAIASFVSTCEDIYSRSGCAPAQPATTREMTAADLEAFLDGLMPAQLEREDIAGAVIAVVKDGQVVFAKGYGYSDMAKRTTVTTDATLFRIGSISKLFVWTSVMQLVEQGKLDLNRDVNDYLDFKIPPAYREAHHPAQSLDAHARLRRHLERYVCS